MNYNQMTLEEKIGQMLCLSFIGTEYNEQLVNWFTTIADNSPYPVTFLPSPIILIFSKTYINTEFFSKGK